MESSEPDSGDFPITGRVVKLELLISLMYFIDHHNGIALWNRTTVKSSFGWRRSNSVDSRLGYEVPEFRQKLAILNLRDSIHGVACGSRQLRLRNNRLELGGSHVASPLRWRGSFLGSFVNVMLLL